METPARHFPDHRFENPLCAAPAQTVGARRPAGDLACTGPKLRARHPAARSVLRSLRIFISALPPRRPASIKDRK